VLAGLRGERSVAEGCRTHQISENPCYTWRKELLEDGAERLAGKPGTLRRLVEPLRSERLLKPSLTEPEGPGRRLIPR
jgi:hypothetical protein